MLPGAIIGEGDCKRAPFLVLGLAPLYGTIFLFLEQIAPSPAAPGTSQQLGKSESISIGVGDSDIHPVPILYLIGNQCSS